MTRGDEEFPALLLTDSGEPTPMTLYLKNTTAEERELLLTGCLMNHYAAQNRRKPGEPHGKNQNAQRHCGAGRRRNDPRALGEDQRELIEPFVELNTEYYDLSLPNRDKTEDAVTRQAAEAIKRLKIGVKCATITPNLQRQEEYGLSQLWKSPNATVRAALDGTVFRAPILLKRVKPVVTCWEKPVTIARHAYGDLYKAVEYRVPGKGRRSWSSRTGAAWRPPARRCSTSRAPAWCRPCTTGTLPFSPSPAAASPTGSPWDRTCGFPARIPSPRTTTRPSSCCFRRCTTRSTGRPLKRPGLTYRYALIDDVGGQGHPLPPAASSGPARTYDGDVMSDLIAAASGSLPMMTSVLVSPMVDASSEHGDIDHEEKEFIQNVFEFDDLTAEEIATHRTDVDLLWLDDTMDDWAETIHNTRHTRYPVCEDSADNVVGILNAKEYFRLADKSRESVMAGAVRAPYFVPETIKADALFRNMKRTGNPLAVVLDEYGGMVGIVTLNDLVEELVGDLGSDDSNILDDDEPRIEKREDGSLVITGNVELDDLEDALGIELDQEEHDTP